MFDPKNFAMNLIKQNPNIANNPRAQEYINVIQSGDSKRGQEIASNILNTYGLTKEQAMHDIASHFNLNM